jgi:hypothetical protein
LNDGFNGDGASARAAFLIEKIQDFAQRVGVRGIPKIGAFAADVDEADLLQLFQMVRERGSRNPEFLLDFAGDHTGWVGCQEQPENLEAGLGAESGEAVGGAGDEERVGSLHISMIAEIWKCVKGFPLSNVFRGVCILRPGAPKLWKRHAFGF